MSNNSARVIVFANNEEKKLREMGREMASGTFPGMHIVNRSPRFFDPEQYEPEPCAAIFIAKDQHPELVAKYKEAKFKVKIFDLKSEEKTKKAPKKTNDTAPINAAPGAEERE